MRIFIGIDLDDEIRGKIARFLEGVSGFAPEARWVRPESLHITLKFIGEQKPEQVKAITHRLRQVRGSPFEIRVSRYGFFPTAKAPRVFWIGIQAGPALAELAAQIDATVSELGILREERAFSPHLTLARGGGRSGDPKWRKSDGPNSVFVVLQKRLAAMGGIEFGTLASGKLAEAPIKHPQKAQTTEDTEVHGEPQELNQRILMFGAMTADKFILYQSQLSPKGSKYTKLERFPMGPVKGT